MKRIQVGEGKRNIFFSFVLDTNILLGNRGFPVSLLERLSGTRTTRSYTDSSWIMCLSIANGQQGEAEMTLCKAIISAGSWKSRGNFQRAPEWLSVCVKTGSPSTPVIAFRRSFRVWIGLFKLSNDTCRKYSTLITHHFTDFQFNNCFGAAVNVPNVSEGILVTILYVERTTLVL